MRALQFAATIVLLTTSASWATSPSWNVVRQFSSKNNPDGAWSYSTNSLPLITDKMYCVQGVRGWATDQPVPDALGIVRNYTGAVVSCQTIRAPIDHLWMDPESGAVTVTWTAPVAGNFTIKGDFVGIDVDEAPHPVTITGPSGTLFGASVATYNQPSAFKLRVTLSAGQTLGFTVAEGSSGYAFLSTGLKAVITQH